jgi:hypothetical protein
VEREWVGEGRERKGRGEGDERWSKRRRREDGVFMLFVLFLTRLVLICWVFVVSLLSNLNLTSSGQNIKAISRQYTIIMGRRTGKKGGESFKN